MLVTFDTSHPERSPTEASCEQPENMSPMCVTWDMSQVERSPTEASDEQP